MCFDLFTEVTLERKTNKQTKTKANTQTKKNPKTKNQKHQLQQNNRVEVLLMEEALYDTKREMTGAGKRKRKKN